MAASDLLLGPLRRQPPVMPRSLRRVLLSINGHLGDVVIATAAVRQLAEALPDAEIGVLLPSWSRVALQNEPAVSHQHVVDHWHTSRSGHFVQRWLAYRRTRRAAIEEIRRIGYDAAVDLYDYFPNAASLLWSAGIPVRIGFDAAGFSALYTHVVSWPDDERHTAERQVILLRTLLPTLPSPPSLRASLPEPAAGTSSYVTELLERHGVQPKSFTVLHPGAGSPSKEWSVENWSALAASLIAEGASVVLTGRGAREHANIQVITCRMPSAVDLSDQLEWHEFVHVIRLARNVISLDSVAGHIAAAVGTHVTVIWTSAGMPHHWRPLGEVSVVRGCTQPAEIARMVAQTSTIP